MLVSSNLKNLLHKIVIAEVTCWRSFSPSLSITFIVWNICIGMMFSVNFDDSPLGFVFWNLKINYSSMLFFRFDIGTRVILWGRKTPKWGTNLSWWLFNMRYSCRNHFHSKMDLGPKPLDVLNSFFSFQSVDLVQWQSQMSLL